MSLALKAAANLLGLPPELAEQLPALAEKIPEFMATAAQVVAGVQQHVATVTQLADTLARIERKLDVLGSAVIDLMEKAQNVNVADLATATAHDGSNNSAAADGNRNSHN